MQTNCKVTFIVALLRNTTGPIEYSMVSLRVANDALLVIVACIAIKRTKSTGAGLIIEEVARSTTAQAESGRVGAIEVVGGQVSDL